MKKRKLTKAYRREIEESVRRLMAEAAFWQKMFDAERELTKQLTNRLFPPDMHEKRAFDTFMEMEPKPDAPTPQAPRKRSAKRPPRRVVRRRRVT